MPGKIQMTAIEPGNKTGGRGDGEGGKNFF